MHEQLIVTEQLESHLLQGPSPALKPICSMQTLSACQETNVATNGKQIDLLAGWCCCLLYLAHIPMPPEMPHKVMAPGRAVPKGL